jgi:hypothetical protein
MMYKIHRSIETDNLVIQGNDLRSGKQTYEVTL